MAETVVRADRYELLDKDGNTRAVLACDRDSGAPTCTFRDSRGQTRLTVGIAWNDMPSLQLGAEDGTARVALIVRPEGDGMIVVVDAEGNKTVVAGK